MAGILRIVFLTALLATPALADESAVVVAADAGVRVGRDPDWKPAAVGTRVGVADLLDIPDKAKVTLRLPDGKTQEILGQALLSGRRLLTNKSASGSQVFFNKAFQDASNTIVVNVEETGSTALAARGAFVAEADSRLGARARRVVTFLSDDDDKPALRSDDADFAESYMRRGEWQLAADAAWLAISKPDSTPLERRRGHLVMARLATNDGKQELALRDLDAACRSAGVESGGKPYIAAALVARGQAWVALGDDAKAIEDFRLALEFDRDGAAGAQANFFLGALALSQADFDTAKYRFALLSGFPELVQAGTELLSAVVP